MRASELTPPTLGCPAEELEAYLRDLARCLARLESAVETLAADAGTGPARRIREILDGVDNYVQARI